MNEIIWLLMLLFAAVCGWTGYFIGKKKGRGEAGAVWGFLLGPIGVLVAFMLPDARPQTKVHASKADPFAEWEAKEKAKTVLAVPTHLRPERREIVFSCACGQSVSAMPDQAGETFSCPACGNGIVVPGMPEA